MTSDDIRSAAVDASKVKIGAAGTAAEQTAGQASEATADAASHTASVAADQAQTVAGHVQDAAATLGTKLQDAASSAREMAGDAVGRAREQVQGLTDSLPGSASDAYYAGQRAVSQGGDSLGRQVAGRPLEALLLAGAIGYLVGWATSRS